MSIIFQLFYQLFSKKVQSIIFTIIFWVKIGHVNYSINYFINYSAKKSLQLFSRLFHTSIIFQIFFNFFINYSEKSLSIIFTIIFLSKLDISIIFRFDFFSKNLDNRPTIVAERLIAQVYSTPPLGNRVNMRNHQKLIPGFEIFFFFFYLNNICQVFGFGWTKILILKNNYFTGKISFGEFISFYSIYRETNPIYSSGQKNFKKPKKHRRSLNLPRSFSDQKTDPIFFSKFKGCLFSCPKSYEAN